ncbi:hypothetical protein PR001_g19013 [Phytophthora rubi]|uniref:Uncharacterized protein n=1 Tax=Phytophthora rubi TaxID=129364 RepID=A0A6A3K203_9STRA|nr:hypothetical protein PR002_g19488 [Phytophthora rubi]KAE8999578.1 hypothetical protein PR001_g19013 [Phytophthora rubi]
MINRSNGEVASAHWSAAYVNEQAQARKMQGWGSLLRPSAIAAYVAIAGRIVVGPIALLLLFAATGYLSDATVFIKADESIFAFTERDPSMAGGCTGCLGPCKIVMLKYKLIEEVAITSAPLLYFHLLGTAQELFNIIKMAKLNLSPQMMRELELAIELADECVTGWTMMSVVRLFQYPTAEGSTDFGQVPAVDTHVFPDYPECRPAVEITDELVGSKLALDTNGRDLLEVVPDELTLFPYSFTSSLPHIARSVPADKSKTKNGATSVVQTYLRAYYGGCRVRAVNTTGIYIEDTCEISNHWVSYGLMVHSPDDIPLCSTGDVCIHNFFNSLWEWQHYIDPKVNNRILLMGIISLYQTMSHKRSVLLTQIWAYRCQNGRMQVVYLAQISYHLVYNSDLYMLGLATGTLTGESIANLTCCFFAFSYSFVNLLKARSGDRQLDRHFRLVWEAMQFGTTIFVGSLLLSWQKAPFNSILSQNAEILRKTSARGAKYCGLNDACVLFTVNIPSVFAVIAVGLGVFAVVTSFAVKSMTPKVKSSVRSAQKVAADGTDTSKKQAVYKDVSGDDELTSFERNCLGTSFHRLFWDCDDIAYVTYSSKRCMTVEALLLTGYLYYGQHIYQASSVMLLLLARLIPSKVLRTFNVLLLRWYVDPEEGTLSHALSCTWYTASDENHKFAAATPVA